MLSHLKFNQNPISMAHFSIKYVTMYCFYECGQLLAFGFREANRGDMTDVVGKH